MTVDEIVGRLAGVRKAPHGWTARCPAHDDRENSLSIGIGDDGRTLLKCFAGCSTASIARVLSVELRDLFLDSPGQRNGHPGRGEGGASVPPDNTATAQHPGCTLATYAEAKRLPVAFLQSLGLADMAYLGAPAIRIPYLDVDGTERAVRFRVALAKDAESDNRFRWRRGDKLFPYGLPRLMAARSAGFVVLTEGESDCHTLWHHDVPALGIPGASSWKDEWVDYLAGIPVVYAVVEPDRAGEGLREKLAAGQLRERLRFVSLGEAKDPSGLYLASPNTFRAAWTRALESAISWQEDTQREAEARAADAWAQCERLARCPRILDRFAEALSVRGMVGETRTAQLVYLLLTSRLLARPVSGSIKGPSSAGKSHLVEQALAFFPASAYYTLSAMSERALAYSQEPLAHRVLVIYEAAGLQGEFASYLMRSLLSEGRVRYETVEKTKDGLRPRLIEREGPTGLLVTTTALRLHPENETRMLSLPVTDTADQTRSIMLAQAGSSEVSTDPPPGGDALADWKALQDWLASSGSRVVVPFATPLADAIPPVAVRLRRDFPTVLSLIRAHALLHQASRDRDSRGWVIATVEDYTIVRGLVADLVADGVEASVSPVLRETVHAVATIHGRTAGDVSVAGLAAELGLDKGPASRRARSAMDRGYLRNLEERRGRPARYVLEDPLPEDRPILPEPERLLAEDRCRVAGETEGMYTPPSPPEREEVVL